MRTDQPPTLHATELAIIGWGPAGLFATYYADLRGLGSAVIDSLPEPGGQVTALLPDKRIYDVAAHPGLTGRDLVTALQQQMPTPPAAVFLRETVVAIERHGGRWHLTTDAERIVQASAVVLCSGAGRFRPRPLAPAVPFLERGATYSPSPQSAQGHHVVVVGGGDSAVDCALSMRPLARSVAIVHRSGSFRAHERSATSLAPQGIDVLTRSVIDECHGEGALSAVTIRDLESGRTTVRPTTHLVVALGLITRPSPFERWGIQTEGGRIRVGSDMQTNLPGVFAAGDAVTYPGRVPLITCGFGEAATAVNNAAALIRQNGIVDPGHSSSEPRDTAAA